MDVNYPHLGGLYRRIYLQNDMTWWRALDKEMATFAKAENLEYVRNQESDMDVDRNDPVIVNYFFHEEITKK